MDDSSDVLAPQCSGETARNETVHHLYALKMTGVGYHIQQGAVEGERAIEFDQFSHAGFAQ